MAPLRCAAKFDPFLSLDCAPTPSTLAQSTERKGSNFAIWQHCYVHVVVNGLFSIAGQRGNLELGEELNLVWIT